MCWVPAAGGPFSSSRCTGSWSAFRPRGNRRRGSDWSPSNRWSVPSSGRSRVPSKACAFWVFRKFAQPERVEPIRSWGGLLFRALFQQTLQLGHELFDILEVQIDGSETNIGNLVELLDAVHQEFSDFASLALALGGFVDKALNFIHQGFELCGRDGALFAGFQ